MSSVMMSAFSCGILARAIAPLEAVPATLISVVEARASHNSLRTTTESSTIKTCMGGIRSLLTRRGCLHFLAEIRAGYLNRSTQAMHRLSHSSPWAHEIGRASCRERGEV